MKLICEFGQTVQIAQFVLQIANDLRPLAGWDPYGESRVVYPAKDRGRRAVGAF